MKRFAPLIISTLFVLAVLISPSFVSQPMYSAELGIAAYSPLGHSGGMVVPASCPSYEHSPGACPPCGMGFAYDANGSCYATGFCDPGYYWNGPDSGCQVCNQNVGPEYRTLACPAGQTGNIYQSRGGYCRDGIYTNDPPVWSEWTTYSNTCVAGGAPTVTINNGPGPITVISGSSVTIAWSCPSPANTSSTNTFNSSTAVSGSGTVTANTTTTYTVACTPTGGQASVQAIVINPSISLSASATRVRANGTSVLTWSATSVTSCTLTGPGVSASATAVSGNVSSRTTDATGIAGQSRYKLTCQTGGGPVSTSVLINIVPSEQEI